MQLWKQELILFHSTYLTKIKFLDKKIYFHFNSIHTRKFDLTNKWVKVFHSDFYNHRLVYLHDQVHTSYTLKNIHDCLSYTFIYMN